jgi:hypothetical protein
MGCTMDCNLSVVVPVGADKDLQQAANTFVGDIMQVSFQPLNAILMAIAMLKCHLALLTTNHPNPSQVC